MYIFCVLPMDRSRSEQRNTFFSLFRREKNSPWPLSEKSERTCTIKYGVQGDGSIGDKVTVESCDPFRDLRTAIGQKKKKLVYFNWAYNTDQGCGLWFGDYFSNRQCCGFIALPFFSCFARLSICTV
jgi:hypothetical protein